MDEKTSLAIATKTIKYIEINLLSMRPVCRKLWNPVQGHRGGLEFEICVMFLGRMTQLHKDVISYAFNIIQFQINK